MEDLFFKISWILLCALHSTSDHCRVQKIKGLRRQMSNTSKRLKLYPFLSTHNNNIIENKK